MIFFPKNVPSSTATLKSFSSAVQLLVLLNILSMTRVAHKDVRINRFYFIFLLPDTFLSTHSIPVLLFAILSILSYLSSLIEDSIMKISCAFAATAIVKLPHTGHIYIDLIDKFILLCSFI